jgi:uncharacterized membrane protein
MYLIGGCLMLMMKLDTLDQILSGLIMLLDAGKLFELNLRCHVLLITYLDATNQMILRFLAIRNMGKPLLETMSITQGKLLRTVGRSMHASCHILINEPQRR